MKKKLIADWIINGCKYDTGVKILYELTDDLMTKIQLESDSGPTNQKYLYKGIAIEAGKLLGIHETVKLFMKRDSLHVSRSIMRKKLGTGKFRKSDEYYLNKMYQYADDITLIGFMLKNI